jgi:tRNA 2-thiouridine synthesizing protein A
MSRHGRFAMDILAFYNRSAPAKMNSSSPPPGAAASATLDITRDICPMTFVRTRLALDRLAPGDKLLVLLKGEEPRRNVPRSAREHGHKVLAEDTGDDGVTRLLLQRS